MDYFTKYIKQTSQPTPKSPVDHGQEFHRSWNLIKNTLLQPDERQLTKGIGSTDVPSHLQSMVDSLVWESTRMEEGGTGTCMEYLLKNDVLGTLVRLSESDRPSGIQAEVLRAVQNMVILLDEQFLVHSVVHKAVLRLLRNCVGDDLQEQLDGHSKVMGAAGSVTRGQPSEYEEDLVNLLCILCSRIRTYRELLMIFFHDKHWYRSEPLFSVDEEEEEEEEEKDTESIPTGSNASVDSSQRLQASSPAPSEATIKSAQPTSLNKKPEYEFLLFNYLLRFVHREGQIGEFSRAGLLFLMDVAMSPSESYPNSTEEIAGSSTDSICDPINDAALALAEYILDGDFSEVLGAGLGAVYSLLPSKLGFFYQTPASNTSSSGMNIGGTPETDEAAKLQASREQSRSMGIEDAQDPDFKARLDHFLKLLEFLQDVLRRNTTHDNVDASALVGTAIVQSILDAVRRIFLENVLYPSILECSDLDGSAVAVMSYIEIMIRTLHEGPLAELFIDFLINEDNEEPRTKQRLHRMLTLGGSYLPQTTEKKVKSKRRKSSAMTLLEMEAPDSRRKSEYFTSMGRFTMKDLLLSNLRSQSQHTSASALQLLQSMLLYHPGVAINRILLVISDPTATSFPHPANAPAPESLAHNSSADQDEKDEDDIFQYPGMANDAPDDFSYASDPFFQPTTTYSTHEREMGLYLALVSRVDPSHTNDVFSTGYDHYLGDALITIQSQAVYQLASENVQDIESRKKLKHRLNVNDPILSLILQSFRRFFSNTPEFNIALTGVLATLALHPDRSLAGWLAFASHDELWSNNEAAGTDVDDDGDDRSIDFRIDEKLANDTNFLAAASLDDNSRPIVHTIFHGLVTQLERYRQLVDNFDKFLLERRQGLLFSENLTDALNLTLDIVDEPRSQIFKAEPTVKPKPKAKSSFVSFLTPKKNKPAKSPVTPEPATPKKKAGNDTVSASPFGSHYHHTESIIVEPFIAPIPSSGPWTPAKSLKRKSDEDDVFTSSGWAEPSEKKTSWKEEGPEETEEEVETVTKVTLSQLLDNVVILEESIKELVAIIHARRSLGIDSLRYL